MNSKVLSLGRMITSSVLTIPLVSAAACGGSINSDTGNDRVVDDSSEGGSTIDDFLAGLQEPMMAPAAPGVTQVDCTPDDLCPTDGPTADGKYECSYKHWTNVEAFDSYAVFQPDLDRLYPGAIFRGSAFVDKGYLDEILFPEGTRAPVEASFSLENTAQSPTIKLDHPTLAKYREERNRVLSGQNGNSPTTVQLSMQQVYSESHFSSAAGATLAFGAGGYAGGVAGGVGAMFGAAFKNQKDTKQNMFMLRMRQQNYQVNLTPKATPGGYVDNPQVPDPGTEPPTDVVLLTQLIGDGVMPVIVSDLFYGRLVLCSVATYASEKETRDAWMSAIAGGLVASGVGVGGAAAAALAERQQQILTESRVDCFVNGGAGSDAVKTVQGVDGIVSAILGSGNQSKETPGGLIGYRLTTLGNRELPITLTTNYTSEECLKTAGQLTMELDRIALHGGGGDQTGSDQEVYGTIGVTYPEPGATLTDCTATGGVGGKTVLLFDRKRDEHVKVNSDFVVDLGTLSTAEVNMQAGSKICVFADLREYDEAFLGIQFNQDDSLGSSSAWVDVKQWDGEFGLNLKSAVPHFRFDLSQ